jgi:SPP1 family phage portal protein
MATNAIQAALLELKLTGGQIKSEIIADLIEYHKSERTILIDLYDHYKGDVPIMSREDKSSDGICNRLPHDFRGEIVDTFTGYLFGNPISYEYESDNETAKTKIEDKLTEFGKLNSIEDLDSKTGKYSSICGKAARLLYQNEDANGGLNDRLINIPPWECIFIKDGSIDEPQYAMRYYTVWMKVNGEWKERYKVEWYDNDTIEFWIQRAEDESYVLDDSEEPNPLPHNYKLIPLIEYINNDEKQGDFVKVAALIDAYDRSVSFNQDELEAFRNAYVTVMGATLGTEEIEKAKDTRVFNVPEGGEISYLIKDIKDEFLEHHLKRLEENIYRFSKCPNMADEKFSGQTQSGESRKFKLIGLENKSITKERKFVKGSRQQFKVLSTNWKVRNIDLDHLSVTMQFTRNLPIELALYADVATALKGTISMRTILSLMPFIDDVEAEMERLKEENYDPLENMDVTRGENENE